jgi:hypothetical protein
MQHLLAILVFLAAYYDTTNAAIGSVPEFTVSDDELIKLVNTMRQKDNETAGFCDVFLDYGVRQKSPSSTIIARWIICFVISHYRLVSLVKTHQKPIFLPRLTKNFSKKAPLRSCWH